MTDDVAVDEFNVNLGERLRLARRSRGWALTDVETRSGGEFKASVVGAYERGERALTVQRLVRLAGMYGVALDNILPGRSSRSETTIDLTTPERVDGTDGAIIDRFLGTIQMMRRANPGELSVRNSDLKILSAMLAEVTRSVDRHEL